MALSCPHCAIPLTKAEHSLGTCPVCDKSFSAAVVQEEAPAWKSARDSFHESPDMDSRAPLGWATVRTALSLMIVGSTCNAFGLVLLSAMESNRLDRQPDSLTDILAPFVVVGIIVGVVLYVTAMCLCVAVPGESGAKPWPWASVGFLIVSGLVLLAISVASSENRVVQRRNLDRQMREMREMGNVGFGAPPRPIAAPEPVPYGDKFFTAAFAIWFVTLSLARNLFICFLCGVAWHFRQRILLISLAMYLGVSLLGDGFILLVSLSQPAFDLQRMLVQHERTSELESWMVVGGLLAYYVWLLVQLLLVRGSVSNELRRRFL